ncbi:MAG: NAD-dependent epimerase/dehydratase family protein [Candidatus Omnitrophica bacterium]|nr:NAD-dependent epimerase/dehydratase family protein [Candidatus Omnitrophota bacterium]
MNQNIFITGAAGKIGKELLKTLLDKGFDNITVLCRTEEEKSSFSEMKITPIVGDLLNDYSYSSYLEDVDMVVHMAAITHTNDISKYYQINSEATLNLISRCEEYGVKNFIYISTRAIAPTGGAYSKSKLMAEKHVKESCLDWMIIRPAEVYGVAGKEGVDMILNNIHKFPFVPIIGDGEYEIAPVHISDVIKAIVSVIERADRKSRIYNIAGPESFTYNQFIAKVLDLKGIKKRKINIPVYVFRILAKGLALVFKDRFIAVDQLPRLLSEKSSDISVAVRDLDYNPVKLEDMFDAG